MSVTFRKVFNSQSHRVYLVFLPGYGLAGTVQLSRTPDGLVDVDYLAPDGRANSLTGLAGGAHRQVRTFVLTRAADFLGRMRARPEEGVAA